jgi:hypothetical protein
MSGNQPANVPPPNPLTKGSAQGVGQVVWRGRPSIGVYVLLYGVISLIAIVVLLVVEIVAAGSTKAMKDLFFTSLQLGSVKIPDAVEVGTVIIVLLFFLAKVIHLAIFKARNSYELRTDGLYVNTGIANLSNTFLSAMAFSDARLIRTLGMRIVGLSLIIVEANDGRRFELKMIKDGMNVQALIRNNLSHPTVRIDRQGQP